MSAGKVVRIAAPTEKLNATGRLEISLPAAYHSGYSCERGRDAPRSVGARAENRVNEQSSRWATLSAREGVNLVKGVTPMTTVKDVQRAQVLIERCMLTYMPFEEVQTKLHHESDVEPALTQIVWRKLQVAPLPTSRSPACLCPPHWPHIASIHASPPCLPIRLQTATQRLPLYSYTTTRHSVITPLRVCRRRPTHAFSSTTYSESASRSSWWPSLRSWRRVTGSLSIRCRRLATRHLESAAASFVVRCAIDHRLLSLYALRADASTTLSIAISLASLFTDTYSVSDSHTCAVCVLPGRGLEPLPGRFPRGRVSCVSLSRSLWSVCNTNDKNWNVETL